MGMVLKKAPAIAAKTAMITGMGLYGLFRVPGWLMAEAAVKEGTIAEGTFAHYVYRFSTMAFLHHMAIIFILLAIIMVIITLLRPLTEPRTMPVSELDVQPHKHRFLIGGITIAATVVLYYIFW